MGRGLLAGLLLCLSAKLAGAGAWPRDPGHGFLSFGYEVSALRDELSGDVAPRLDGYSTFYGEFGLTPRLTIGIDAGGDETGLTSSLERQFHQMSGASALPEPDRNNMPRLRTWSSIVFLRYALSPLDAKHRFALQLGAGQRAYTLPGRYNGTLLRRNETILRPALSYGVGFTLKDRPGWLSIEGSVEMRQDTRSRAVKLDSSLGLKGNGRLTYMLQVQTGDFPNSDPYVKVQPAIVVALPYGMSLESGLIWGLHANDSVGARLGLWIEF